MTNIARAAEVLADWVLPGVSPEVIAQALADATPPLLMPDPQIIRTVEELEALEPDTVVMLRDWHKYETAKDAVEYIHSDRTFAAALPAVVVTPAEQVRAARKALEEA